MDVELLETNFEDELRAFQARRSGGRTKGRHLSDIIRYYITRVEPERFKGLGIDPTMAEGGFLWEDVWSSVMAKRFGCGQIEIVKDRVIMTLDGFNAADWRVVEYKNTKMAAPKTVEGIKGAKFFHWHMQIMGYCLGMETAEAELVPHWVNGAYELGGGRFGKPTVGFNGRPFLLKYTRRELVDNWRLIRKVEEEMPEAA